MKFVNAFSQAAIGALAMAALAVPAITTPAFAQTTEASGADLNLSVGRGRLVTLPANMTDVFVANDGVADVQVRSARQLYVFGKAPGETTIFANDAQGRTVYSATIRVGNNIETIDQMLSLAMPNANVLATPMNGFVLLTGTVAAPEDGAEAERLVQAFVGENTQVISRLQTATPLQVNLQVRIAEVNRSFLKEIGGNLTSIDRTGGFLFGVGSGRSSQAVTIPVTDPSTGITTPGRIGQKPGATTIGGIIRDVFGLDLGVAFDLAEQASLVTTLAQPNLTALSGETADFLAGGEFPIPIAGADQAITIEYKKFGVSLAYTPIVLSNGRISMRVRPEVSELSSEGAVTIAGFTVPSLTVRRAETTVELGSGESLMIAGLLNNRAIGSVDKAPGLGDVPILGTLFRSDAFRRGETELVIIVTPYLVEPVTANRIALPTDGYRNASDLERVFLGMAHDGVTGGDRPKPTVAGAPGDPAPALTGAARTPATVQQQAAAKPEKGSKSSGPGFSF